MVEPAMLANVRTRLTEELDSPPKVRRSPFRARIAVGASVVALAAASVLWFRSGAEDAVPFHVGPAAEEGRAGQWIAAPDDAPWSVSFADGSEVELRAGASLRVAESTDERTWLIVENGEVEVKTAQRDGPARFQFDFGPYVVHAAGAHFTAEYDPHGRLFTLTSQRGELLVRGPGTTDGMTVPAGHSLRVHDGGRRLELTGSDEERDDPTSP